MSIMFNEICIYIYICIYCSIVRFKEECPPHRIDCPLGRKTGGRTRAEENCYETLRADCVEKGWICHVIPIEVGCRGFFRTHSHFVSFKNRTHWPHFESCLKSSSDRGAICNQVGFGRKREIFGMKEIHTEPPFPCDYVRNGYCKRVIISTAESKRVFF